MKKIEKHRKHQEKLEKHKKKKTNTNNYKFWHLLRQILVFDLVCVD